MAQENEEAPQGYTIVGHEKKILHTYNINGKQIKDTMELTIHDSVTNKKWHKAFTQNDFMNPIKEVYAAIKDANATDKIAFTYPNENPDSGSLAMDVNGQFTIDLPQQNE